MTKQQRAKFFAMAGRAARHLGEPTEAYRYRVMREVAGVNTVFGLTAEGVDRCLERFAADAGDWRGAGDAAVGSERRWAYLVKVTAAQLMQLKGRDEREAWRYLEGILNQARIACGRYVGGEGWWLDVAPHRLREVFQILDTERRRMVRALFPKAPLGFDDTVRYEVDGPLRTRVTGLPKGHYAGSYFWSSGPIRSLS